MNRGQSRKAIATKSSQTAGMGAFKPKSGRQSKTLADLPQGWVNLILKEMSEGASELEIKALLRLRNDTHAKWMAPPEEKEPDLYAEYREVVEEGRVLGQAWWERIGRRNLKNSFFNNTLWYMNMKNRFGWKDKSEVTTYDPARPKDIKEAIKLGANTIVF